MKNRSNSMKAERLRSQADKRAKRHKPAGGTKGAGADTARHAKTSADLIAHRQLEAAQWESDERYRTVVEDLTEVICRSKADGTMLFVNEVYCRFFGKTRRTLLGKKWHPLAVPEDHSKIEALLRTLSPANPVVIVENRVYSGRGEVRWMQFVNRGFFDADGRLVETQAIGRDITERKRAEESLRESETIFRLLAENIEDAFWISTPALDRIIYVSPAYEKIWGRTCQSLYQQPQSFAEAIHPDDQSWVMATIQAHVHGHWNVEYRIIQPDGTMRWILDRGFPVRDQGGQLTLICGVAKDITEQKRAETEVQRLASFPRFNPNPVLEVSFDGTVTYMNPTTAVALKHLGLEDARSFIPLDWSAIVNAFRQGRTEPLQREVPIKDRLFNEWVCFSPGSDVTRIYARDITEQRRAEAAVQAFSQEIVAAREEERKQVSAILHHDVGSLAVGISAHLDAIEEDIRSGKPREALKWVRRTRKLFGQSASRLKALAFRLRPPELDVLGLPAALRQYFSQMTIRRATRIHFRENLVRRQLSRDTATILFRVAQEALTNAIKHGHAKQVAVDLRASKKDITLTITNNGKDFDPSGLEARTSSIMGLRVMREMVAGARGTFAVQSGRGKGTTVRVTLPLGEEKPEGC